MSQPCPRLGMLVAVTGHTGASYSLDRALREDLLSLLGANGLATNGASGGREYVVTREGGQVTDVDRMLLLEWAARWAHVASIGVSPPVDLNDDGG